MVISLDIEVELEILCNFGTDLCTKGKISQRTEIARDIWP